MAHEFAKNRPTVDVIRDQLKMEPEAFDKDFLAEIDKETGKTVANFKEWTTGLGELNKLSRTPGSNNDEIISKGRALEAIYPDYVEAGNAYVAVAKACLAKEDKACAMAEYREVLEGERARRGRDKAIREATRRCGQTERSRGRAGAPELRESTRSGSAREAGRAVHEDQNAAGRGTRIQVLIALHPIDVAGSHYNLAKAYQAEGQKDKAREEVLNALEAAPEYRPAQKLLLEVERRRQQNKTHVHNRDSSTRAGGFEIPDRPFPRSRFRDRPPGAPRDRRPGRGDRTGAHRPVRGRPLPDHRLARHGEDFACAHHGARCWGCCSSASSSHPI